MIAALLLAASMTVVGINEAVLNPVAEIVGFEFCGRR